MLFDTDGNKGLLSKGEFGYDDYVSSVDTHRLYYGTGEANKAIVTMDDLSVVLPTPRNLSSTEIGTTVPLGSGEIVFLSDINEYMFFDKNLLARYLLTSELVPLTGKGTGLPGTFTEVWAEPIQIEGYWDSILFGSISSNDGRDRGKWNRRTGTTPSSRTGPTSAYVGECYLYTETSSSGHEEVFKLTTSNFSHLRDLSFSLSMYGRDIGLLQVITYSNNVPTVRYSIDGDQGQAWFDISLSLTGLGIEKIEFKYSDATGSRGDFAIDNINIVSV